MVENNPNAGKPENKPTQVREPDNTRPPGDPTPQKPNKPMEAGTEETPETDGE